MKQIITLYRTSVSLVFFIFLLTGCSKDGGSGKSYNIIDKNYFFTVNINGKSFTSYGWYQSDYADVWNGAPFIYSSNNIDPLSVDTIRNAYVSVMDYAPNNLNPKAVGNCNADFRLTKKGSRLGTYTLVKGPRADHKFYGLDGKSYFIDQEGEQFNITRITPFGTAKTYVEGTFSCNLWEVNGSTTTLIPATGSFRLEGY